VVICGDDDIPSFLDASRLLSSTIRHATLDYLVVLVRIEIANYAGAIKASGECRGVGRPQSPPEGCRQEIRRAAASRAEAEKLRLCEGLVNAGPHQKRR
jgi:hypothetical protein